MAPIFQLDGASTWRGGEQQVFYLHQGLLALGRDSRVICREGSALQQRLASARLPYYGMPLQSSLDLPSAWRIGGLVRRESGMLHTHTSQAHSLGLWAKRLRGDFPLIVSRRVDFPVATNWLSRRKYLSPANNLYLAISSGVEHELLAGGIAATRIRRVPSGIDFTRFDGVKPDHEWRASLGVARGQTLFGSVAALAPHKDQATLLDAFAHYRRQGGQGLLVILGEGELRSALEAQRARLGLEEEILLPGFTDEVLPKLASFDVFVLSSNLEGLGTSILDAMALGRCVVATRTGGIPDAVIDNKTGLLAPVGDAAAFAAAMDKVDRDLGLRQRLADGARRHVQSFDVRETVQSTMHAYDEVHSEDTQ